MQTQPSPSLDDAIRQRMQAAAARVLATTRAGFPPISRRTRSHVGSVTRRSDHDRRLFARAA